MPILMQEYKIITKAQQVKGYYPNLREIKKYCLSIFIPYISKCFKRVDEISIALQIKGYES